MATSDNPWKNITFHISRTSQDKYQIILVDSDGDIEISQKAAEKMRKSWEKRYSSYGFYFWVERSGTGPPSAMKKAGNIFGFLFIMGLMGALVYLAVMKYKKNKPDMPLSFNHLGTRIVSVWTSSIGVSI